MVTNTYTIKRDRRSYTTLSSSTKSFMLEGVELAELTTLTEGDSIVILWEPLTTISMVPTSTSFNSIFFLLADGEYTPALALLLKQCGEGAVLAFQMLSAAAVNLFNLAARDGLLPSLVGVVEV